ncbi:CACTA en-spm transposon protein [Cucumis melo var. makuwa]|uniref:CACTA en-spm transposon protein n=1 Tax=Cucumis melo var. makuwa TaxID=1194695 RepID=A0A5D3E620_CUCMM|nr:CACTA en-spm transposon protein [Cucumis melo var. makuwa]
MQEQSRTNKVARQKQPYNYSSGSKSFLQRQHELAEKKGKSIDCVELFWKTHVRVGMFVSQVIEYVHNQMLELQSQPTLEGSQPFSRDKICDQIEVQDRNHAALASQVEQMQKLIEDLTRAHQGPPHDP